MREAADRDGPLQPGRREANKHEKLLRIRHAAKTVFLSKGYDAATIREIAVAADVAFGTLFLYAKNKRDLLLLVFEEEFVVLAERAARHVDPNEPVTSQLTTFFLAFYKFFSMTPALSRDMLREVTFNTQGIVAQRIWEGIEEIEQHLSRLVARAQSKGLVNSGVSPSLAAHVIFSLHRIELRACLDSDEPDIPASLRSLREQFDVLFMGLNPFDAKARSHTGTPLLRQTAKQPRDSQRHPTGSRPSLGFRSA